MDKQHYALVSNHFNLVQYHDGNHPDAWKATHEGTIEKIRIKKQIHGSAYMITCDTPPPLGGKFHLFVGIPTIELAEKIVSYIEETKLLFL